MHEHATLTDSKTEPGLILVGNPNVGKSVIFSSLSGKYVTVSNYPGTTVELSKGTLGSDFDKEPIIDTPGINNLLPASEDERVTRDLLLRSRPRAVLQVADAKNLRRALLLTVQLAEMGLPVVFDLYMTDEALSRGVMPDAQRLAENLGHPAIPRFGRPNR